MITPEFREMVKSLMVKPDGRVIPLEVAVLGVVGELDELYEASAKLLDAEARELYDDYHAEASMDLLYEAGDVLWYLVAIEEILGARMNLVQGTSPFIYSNACKLAEIAKKVAWHDRNIELVKHNILDHVGHLALRVLLVLRDSGMTVEAAQSVTLVKLKKRWPLGFGVQP